MIVSQAALAAPLALPSGGAAADPFLWYVTRAAAVSAYVTLGATAALGLWRSLARVGRRRVPWTLDEAHQFLALLTAAFVALHLLSLLLDPFIPFTLGDLLLPLGQPYRPVAVDLGVLALYALAIVLFSSWLRRRIAYASWRALHYVSFAAFALVTLHGMLAGADGGQGWMRLIYLGAGGLVGLLTIVRMLWSPQGTSGRPTSAGAPPPSAWPRSTP